MSKISRTDKDQLNTLITVTVEQSDYQDQYKKELQKYREQAHMKGFRKGKTPLGVIRKMYGKGVLADLVNKAFQENLANFIKEEDLNIIGQPLLAEGQPLLDFDPKSPTDFQLEFEVGHLPDFELNGLNDEVFKMYQVVVPEDMLKDDLENGRMRFGNRINAEEDIQENDSLTFRAQELENGAIKEGGIDTTFFITMDLIADPKVKEEILTKKKGDELQLDIFNLEDFSNRNISEEDKAKFIKKYYLKLEDDDDRDIEPVFHLTIQEVNRQIPAELNETFFQQFFGPDSAVSNEEEALERIKKDYEYHYTVQAKSILYQDVIEKLFEQNPIELPEAFLKRWVLTSDEHVSENKVDAEFDKYLAQVKRSVLRSKLAEIYELKATEEEVAKAVINSLQQYAYYLQIHDQATLIDMAQRTMANPKEYQRYEDQVITGKLQDSLSEKLNLEEVEISIEDFTAKMEELNEVIDARSPNFEADKEEE